MVLANLSLPVSLLMLGGWWITERCLNVSVLEETVIQQFLGGNKTCLHWSHNLDIAPKVLLIVGFENGLEWQRVAVDPGCVLGKTAGAAEEGSLESL